jgi:hypothetical protein
MQRDGINSIIIRHHYDKLMTSRLRYFLDLALFFMCRIVSWPKYDNQFTNSCLAYDGL